MHEFGNPNPYSAVRFINEVTSDLHRSHPRSSEPPTHPNLAHSIEYTISSTSWVALKVNRWVPASRDEITAGADDTLMDYDHRWDSSSVARRVGAILPRSVARRIRDLGLRGAQVAEMRSLFRRDATPPSPS